MMIEDFIEQKTRPVSEDYFVKCMNMEQGTEEWLESRKGVVTGSKVASFLGNGYHPFKRGMLQIVHPETNYINSIYTGHGTMIEPFIEGLFCVHFQQRVDDPNDELQDFFFEECGMILNYTTGSWQGYSPDGIIHCVFANGETAKYLCEFKAPYSKRHVESSSFTFYKDGVTVPRSTERRFHEKSLRQKENKENKVPYSNRHDITPYYYDQIQWGMGIGMETGKLSLRSPSDVMKCYFVVHTFHCTKIQEVEFDCKYYEYMKEESFEVYKKIYVPSILKKDSNEGLGKNELVNLF